jgi:hypothetical protein
MRSEVRNAADGRMGTGGDPVRAKQEGSVEVRLAGTRAASEARSEGHAATGARAAASARWTEG